MRNFCRAKRDALLAFVPMLLAASACSDVEVPATSPSFAAVGDTIFSPDHYGIAEAYAPIIHQQVRSPGSYQDQISLITYDGDWNTGNNWENLDQGYPIRGYVYWSLTETYDHYFVYYSLYHPRDWCEWGLPIFGGIWCDHDRHENDLESILVVVDKGDTTSQFPFGRVVLMDTRAHSRIYTYRNTSDYCSSAPAWRSPISFGPRSGGSPDYLRSECVAWTTDDEGVVRPVIWVESQGHGIYSRADSRTPPGPSGDQITYYPNGMQGFVADLGAGVGYYGLKWINDPELYGTTSGLWSRRMSSLVFHDVGTSGGIGPYGKHYGVTFRVEGAGENNGLGCWLHLVPCADPVAPWGQYDGHFPSSIWPGDWHNHGAFALSARYQSLSWDYLYPYQYEDWWPWEDYYISNMFLDEANPPANPIYFSSESAQGAADVSDPELDRPLEPHPEPFRFWDARQLASLTTRPSSGEGCTGSLQVSMVRDTLWGYKGNLRDVLRLVGQSVELIIPADDINPELLFTATLRYRGIAGDVAPALRWRDRDVAGWTAAVPLETLRQEPGGWTIARARLWRAPAWYSVSGPRVLNLAFRSDSPCVGAEVSFLLLGN